MQLDKKLIGHKFNAFTTTVEAGKIRVLGLTYQKPTKLMPGVQPVSDTVPGFELLGWYGMNVPLKTPPAVISRINAELVKVARAPLIVVTIASYFGYTLQTNPDAGANGTLASILQGLRPIFAAVIAIALGEVVAWVVRRMRGPSQE